MDVKITCELFIKNLIDKEHLNLEFEGNLLNCVKELVRNEGLSGVIEDEVNITNVEEIKATVK